MAATEADCAVLRAAATESLTHAAERDRLLRERVGIDEAARARGEIISRQVSRQALRCAFRSQSGADTSLAFIRLRLLPSRTRLRTRCARSWRSSSAAWTSWRCAAAAAPACASSSERPGSSRSPRPASQRRRQPARAPPSARCPAPRGSSSSAASWRTGRSEKRTACRSRAAPGRARQEAATPAEPATLRRRCATRAPCLRARWAQQAAPLRSSEASAAATRAMMPTQRPVLTWQCLPRRQTARCAGSAPRRRRAAMPRLLAPAPQQPRLMMSACTSSAALTWRGA